MPKPFFKFNTDFIDGLDCLNHIIEATDFWLKYPHLFTIDIRILFYNLLDAFKIYCIDIQLKQKIEICQKECYYSSHLKNKTKDMFLQVQWLLKLHRKDYKDYYRWEQTKCEKNIEKLIQYDGFNDKNQVITVTNNPCINYALQQGWIELYIIKWLKKKYNTLVEVKQDGFKFYYRFFNETFDNNLIVAQNFEYNYVERLIILHIIRIPLVQLSLYYDLIQKFVIQRLIDKISLLPIDKQYIPKITLVEQKIDDNITTMALIYKYSSLEESMRGDSAEVRYKFSDTTSIFL